MEKNAGTIDRISRVVIGIVLLYTASTIKVVGIEKIVIALLGLIWLVTAAFKKLNIKELILLLFCLPAAIYVLFLYVMFIILGYFAEMFVLTLLILFILIAGYFVFLIYRLVESRIR